MKIVSAGPSLVKLSLLHNLFTHSFNFRRGPIWININYLAVRALHFYGHQEGPYQQVQAALNLIYCTIEQT